MFKRFKRLKGNKLAFDDDTAKEVAAWIATYAHHADTGYERCMRAVMTTGDKTAEGNAKYWENAGKTCRWLISMIRVPIRANDLYLAYIRHANLIGESQALGKRGQLELPMGESNVNPASIEGSGWLHNQGIDNKSVEGKG